MSLPPNLSVTPQEFLDKMREGNDLTTVAQWLRAAGWEAIAKDKQTQEHIQEIVRRAIHDAILENGFRNSMIQIDGEVLSSVVKIVRKEWPLLLELASRPTGEVLSVQMKAREIRDDVSKLEQRRDKVKKKLKEEKAAISAMLSVTRKEYQPVPSPICPATDRGEGVPECSGIYFVWRSEIIQYVGQAIRLNRRARLKGHHVMQPGDILSWLEFPYEEVDFAESYYIGICKPCLNFGSRAKIQRALA